MVDEEQNFANLKLFRHGNGVQPIVELCAIGDDVADCDTLSYNDACHRIDLIS